MKLPYVQHVSFGCILLLAPAALRAQDSTSPDPSHFQAPVQSASVAQSQQPGNQAEATPGISNDPQIMKDKQFIRKASAGGLAEVELGKLALQKTSNDGVKAFAQKMVDDHTMLNDTIKPIADALGAKTATHMNKMDQAEYDKLNALSGNDFDKEYIAFMVKDHRGDLHEFHEEADTAGDPALKDAVTKGAKVIHEHLRMIEKLASDNGVKVPGPQHPAPAV